MEFFAGERRAEMWRASVPILRDLSGGAEVTLFRRKVEPSERRPRRMGPRVLFAGVLAIVVLLGSPGTGNAATGDGGSPAFSRGGVRLHRFQDPEMDFQFLRSLGADCYGGGSVGELLGAAEGIEDGNPASWSAAFGALAERVERDARGRLALGHTVSARDAFLRASSYYRAAEYYGEAKQENTRAWGSKCRETFLAGAALFGWALEDLRIPLGDESMPAYFFRSGPPGEPRKTILIQSGFDGTAEEMFFAGGRGALERGYNVLLFEGPGQVGMRRFHENSVFVPDLGPAVRALYDHVSRRADVDPQKVALYGASLGGYFSLSGALGEPRLAALISNSPVLDMAAYFAASMGPAAAHFQEEDLTLEDLDALSAEELLPKYRWALRALCLRFGRPSVRSVLDRMKDFRIASEDLARFSTPALAMVSRGEGTVPVGQAELFAATAPRATLRIFESESGAHGHCQLDNLPHALAVLFDWLDEVLEP